MQVYWVVPDREAVFSAFIEEKWNTFKHIEHILSFGPLESIVLEITDIVCFA